MKSFNLNLNAEAVKNNNFRKVLYTSKHIQIVLMTLKSKEEIGSEVHQANDQFFYFAQGQGKCIFNNHSYNIGTDSAFVIPAGKKHNIINTSKTEKLKMYTIYSPPHHKDGIVQKTNTQVSTKKEPV